MKIAVCFSGLIRLGVHAAPWLNNFLSGINVDVFMHTWTTTKNKEWHPESKLYQKNTQIITEEDSLPLITEFKNKLKHKFISIQIEDQMVWQKTSIQPHKNISPLWYSWYKSVELVKNYEAECGQTYDIIVKLRPDIVFPYDYRLIDEVEHFKKNPNIFYAMGYSSIRVDDVVFLANSQNTYVACQLYNWLKKNDLSWTTNIFGEYLQDSGIQGHSTTRSNYAVIRPENSNCKDFEDVYNTEMDYYAPKSFTFRMSSVK